MTQTIRRAVRRHRFVIADQAAVEDVRLSWAARGLLAYLLSLPDDWKVLVNDLKRRGNLGRDGIYTLLRELRTAGYVKYISNRDEEGRIRGGTYIVSEIPQPVADPPETAKPEAGEPDPGDPDALLNTQSNKPPIYTKRQTTTYGRENSSIARNPDIPRWVPTELHSSVRRITSDLEGDAQLVINEWAGAMAAGAIRFSPLGFLRVLVRRFQRGEMTVRYAFRQNGRSS